MNTKHPANKGRILATLFIVPILVLFAGSRVHSAEFRLIYANDNLGELDGCG
jgi:hypothetical protein